MAEARVCPHCGVDLVAVPEKPDAGTCLQHGEFHFIDRMSLDDVGEH